MPKHIINDWSGGLSDTDKNLPSNQFAVGDGLDIHTQPGYIIPSLATSVVTYSTAPVPIIDYTILDIAVDAINSKVYHIDDSKLYQQTTIDGSFNANFDGSDHYYYAITGSSILAYAEQGAVIYKINGVSKLLYIYGLDVAAGAANGGDIGMYPLTGTTFDDDFMSTTPVGAAKLYKTEHPYLEWNSILWIGNGRYLAKFDGTTAGGANGTLTPTQLDLGEGWTITALFPTRNLIGIVARKSLVGQATATYTDSKVVFYDGTSTNPTYSTNLTENSVGAAINFNGRILFLGSGRNPAAQLLELTDEGCNILKNLKLSLAGAMTNFGTTYPKGIVPIRDRLLLATGATSNEATILSYGKNKQGEPDALSFPYVISTSVNSQLRFIKQITSTIFYFSWYDGTYYLSKINLAGTTYGTANYKGGYVDFGQRIKINYVKFYFKPLVASDSITCGLDIDYGTAVTLKDNANASAATYSVDGAITSKKFMVGRECHAFRPTIIWNVGGVAVSKIVIDYNFVPNDN